jgi:hypothetical protein
MAVGQWLTVPAAAFFGVKSQKHRRSDFRAPTNPTSPLLCGTSSCQRSDGVTTSRANASPICGVGRSQPTGGRCLRGFHQRGKGRG